ncbi:MAG TPA: hypothetical protein VFY05_13350 [Candidatus Angelobacter sp.]|nr:hypothetical protein [Candidatus Angelobacter sp.]
MNTPFGVEYLEPITASDEAMGSTACVQEQTYHLSSGTVTNELVCDN